MARDHADTEHTHTDGEARWVRSEPTDLTEPCGGEQTTARLA